MEKVIDTTPAKPALVLFAVTMVRRRAHARLADAALTQEEIEKAVRTKVGLFGQMTTPELAAKLLLDLSNEEFHPRPC